jgi:hypothetical protein
MDFVKEMHAGRYIGCVGVLHTGGGRFAQESFSVGRFAHHGAAFCTHEGIPEGINKWKEKE